MSSRARHVWARCPVVVVYPRYRVDVSEQGPTRWATVTATVRMSCWTLRKTAPTMEGAKTKVMSARTATA
eukprot:10269396-Lingulodinium_polyedra.AAC.1